jgi:hypothetical protein
VDSNDSRIATAQDFLRSAASRWVALPGIRSFPKFRRICTQIIKRDDQWIRGNWNGINKVLDSDGVRLFLLRRRQLNFMAVAEATKAKNPKLRREAQKALGVFYASVESARMVALMESFSDPKGRLVAEELLALRENLPSQPAVVRQPRELNGLADLALSGRYSDLDRYLDRRLAEVKHWWKQKLGVPSHRKAPRSIRFNRLFAYNLKKQGRSWRDIAREVSPEDYGADPQRTIDRIKKGVKALWKQNSRTKVTTSPAAASAIALAPKSRIWGKSIPEENKGRPL